MTIHHADGGGIEPEMGCYQLLGPVFASISFESPIPSLLASFLINVKLIT
jgi:hypothetical protein